MAYYFNLPIFDDLTLDQQTAVDETKLLSLSGGPGTGKSVVSLWRHIRNHATGSGNSLLLTYTKTLEHYLRACARSQNKISGQNIGRIYDWLTHDPRDYEEIIIDEAQDINQERFQQFFNYTDKVSFGADERQSIYLNQEQLENLLNWLKEDNHFQNNIPITLNRNFRNSKEILLFTRSVFPDFMISQNTITGARETGIKPIMKINLGWDTNNQINSIKGIISDFRSQTHNIAILVPFQNMVDKYYEAIRQNLDNKVEITKYKSDDDIFTGLAGVHVTTFKSAKGTEFDTVIIPEFDRYTWILQNMDKIGKNDYYVAFTRTKTNLFLLCRNSNPNIGDINTVNIEQ